MQKKQDLTELPTIIQRPTTIDHGRLQFLNHVRTGLLQSCLEFTDWSSLTPAMLSLSALLRLVLPC